MMVSAEARGSGGSANAVDPRVGVWIFGALGSISTHVIVGAAALARGLTPATGLVTALEPLAGLDLVAHADDGLSRGARHAYLNRCRGSDRAAVRHHNLFSG